MPLQLTNPFHTVKDGGTFTNFRNPNWFSLNWLGSINQKKTSKTGVSIFSKYGTKRVPATNNGNRGII